MERDPEEVILLVHGIRTHAYWAEMVARIVETSTRAKVQPIKYGFFDVLRFLSPFVTRRAPVERIVREYRDVHVRYPHARISVIAHSFGTYAVTKALQEPDIVFHKIIFCGSIAPSEFRVARYRAQIGWDPILNDCGTHDVMPVLAQCVTWGYSATGTFGFGTVGIRDRFSKFAHSAFFTDSFVRDFWVPYLTDGKIVGTEWEIKRSTPPYWQSLLAWLPLRWIVPLGIVGVVAWLGYPLLRADAPPSLIVNSPIYIGHYVGVPIINAKLQIKNQSSTAIQFMLRQALLRAPNDSKLIRLAVEFIFECDGSMPQTFSITVSPHKTTTCAYSLLGDFSSMADIAARVPMVSTPAPNLIRGELLLDLRVRANRNFSWVPGEWHLDLEHQLSDAVRTTKVGFAVSAEDIDQMKSILNYYDAGYGVLYNYRVLRPDGSSVMPQVVVNEIADQSN
jgi:hypothetical protein